MELTFSDICSKEVVSIKDGVCFGFADDLVLETEAKAVKAIVIKGKLHFFGILGRDEDITIPWENIETIGEDAILVKYEGEYTPKLQKMNFIEKILNYF